MEKITVAAKVGLEKQLLTNQEIESLINPISDKKVIQESFSDVEFDKYANEKDQEKDY